MIASALKVKNHFLITGWSLLLSNFSWQAEAKAHEEGEQATKQALKQDSKIEQLQIKTRIARAKK